MNTHPIPFHRSRTTSFVHHLLLPCLLFASAAAACHASSYSTTAARESPPLAADAVTNGGFEMGNLQGWTATGEAFSVSPINSGLSPGWKDWDGKWYANSWSTKSQWAATGSLRSTPFILKHGAVAFVASGWGSAACHVSLHRAADGALLDRVFAPMKGDLGFHPNVVYAPDLMGESVYVEVRDEGSGRNDWICVDAFQQVPFDPEALPLAIDISGNWLEAGRDPSRIQTREPPLQEGKALVFQQALRLLPGEYEIELAYDPLLDKKAGRAIGGNYAAVSCLQINGETRPFAFKQESPQAKVFTGRVRFALKDANEVAMTLTWGNTRVPRTQLRCLTTKPRRSPYFGVGVSGHRELAVVNGVPFCTRRLEWFRSWLNTGADHGSLVRNGGPIRFEHLDVAADRIHFLGMIHNIDLGNGSWYSPKGDHGFSHFVGDQAGSIILEWADGERSVVPLVFGFNLWWSRPWDMAWHYNWNNPKPGPNYDGILFGGRDAPRTTIADGVRLVDGIRIMGAEGCNARYVFSLDTGGRKLKAIVLQGSETLHDVPLISAITVESSADCKLTALPGLGTATRVAPVSLEHATTGGWQPKTDAVAHLLYTFANELPSPQTFMIPDGYFGPAYAFRGAPEAVYAADFLYRNGPECASHIADSGVGCSSPTAKGQLVQYLDGMGIWFEPEPFFKSIENWFNLYKTRKPGQHPGAGSGWTRGEAPLFRETMAFGYDKYIDSYLDWLDHAMMTEADPPHWNRVAGATWASATQPVGDIIERGNRENDGHGMCMSARYMVWHWKGRPEAWNRRRWEVTKAAVEWIQWQLDNDHIRPGVDKDVLFTESECAHSDYGIYSSYHCLHGLKLCIRMAEQLGETETAARWHILYARLRQGILDNLVDKSESGAIWHVYPHSDWQDHAHALMHIDMAPDGDTFTPLEDYPRVDQTERGYLEISRNTYRHLMREGNYNCLRMYGYGQGYMTQAAILLDEMRDAEQFVNMLVRHAWLPKLGGWTCPEGIILHRSGEKYLPVNGYMGQDVHVAEATKAMRLMLGFDDNNPELLRIVPRFPNSWERAEVRDFPVLVGQKRIAAAYDYIRTPARHIFAYTFADNVPRFSVRLGPLPKTASVQSVQASGKAVPYTRITSGDSDWLWIKDLSGREGNICGAFD